MVNRLDTHTNSMTGLPKASYDTEQAGRYGAILAESRFGIRMRVYQCPTCGRWHYRAQLRTVTRIPDVVGCELGLRVVRAMADENGRTEKERRGRLRRRFRDVGQWRDG